MKTSNVVLSSGNRKNSDWKSLNLIEKEQKNLFQLNNAFSESFFDSLNSDNYRTRLRKPLNNLLRQFAKGTTKTDKAETLAEIKKLEKLLLKNGSFSWNEAKNLIAEITAIK